MYKKRIICYGDSNTWGYDGCSKGRFNDKIRWTSLLQKKLGLNYDVIEEGLSGRTTIFDDPHCLGLSGINSLEMILNKHAPISMLIIMLGTNDLKEYFNATAEMSVKGLDLIIEYALDLKVWEKNPIILIVAPICMDKRLYQTDTINVMGKDCVEKSFQLPLLQKQIAILRNCYFVDCNESCTVNNYDFMHLSKESLEPLANNLYERVLEVFNDKRF